MLFPAKNNNLFASFFLISLLLFCPYCHCIEKSGRGRSAENRTNNESTTPGKGGRAGRGGGPPSNTMRSTYPLEKDISDAVLKGANAPSTSSPRTGTGTSNSPNPNPKPGVYAYSNVIIEESCTSMESALLAGWDYHLLTKVDSSVHPALVRNNSHSLRGPPGGDGVQQQQGSLNGSASSSPQMNKLNAYRQIINKHSLDKEIVVFVDAYDVVFQGNADIFYERLKPLIKGNKDNLLMFNSEGNCHPFNVLNERHKCPITQGDAYIKAGKFWHPTPVLDGSEPLACKLQAQRTRAAHLTPGAETIFLNSGVSIGYAYMYTKMLDMAEALSRTWPKLCLIDDQALIGWIFAKSMMPMQLDYNQSVLSVSHMKALLDHQFNSATGMWTPSANGTRVNAGAREAPLLVHFAGSKRAMRIYADTIYDWHVKRAGGKEQVVLERLEKSTINMDGKEVPFRKICPAQNKLLRSVYDTVTKHVNKLVGIKHAVPADCPRKYCPE